MEVQVFSFKTLDLVANQNSAESLTKASTMKIVTENLLHKIIQGQRKFNQGGGFIL